MSSRNSIKPEKYKEQYNRKRRHHREEIGREAFSTGEKLKKKEDEKYENNRKKKCYRSKSGVTTKTKVKCKSKEENSSEDFEKSIIYSEESELHSEKKRR